jgi:hypothetical protein
VKRQPRLLFVLLALASAGLAAEDVRDELPRLQKEAQAAYRGHDYKAFLDTSRKISALAPRSSRALYNLARAYALNGAKADAAATLDRLARMGLGEIDEAKVEPLVFRTRLGW